MNPYIMIAFTLAGLVFSIQFIFYLLSLKNMFINFIETGTYCFPNNKDLTRENVDLITSDEKELLLSENTENIFFTSEITSTYPSSTGFFYKTIMLILLPLMFSLSWPLTVPIFMYIAIANFLRSLRMKTKLVALKLIGKDTHMGASELSLICCRIRKKACREMLRRELEV